MEKKVNKDWSKLEIEQEKNICTLDPLKNSQE